MSGKKTKLTYWEWIGLIEAWEGFASDPKRFVNKKAYLATYKPMRNKLFKLAELSLMEKAQNVRKKIKR